MGDPGMDIVLLISVASVILTAISILLALFPRKPRETITIQSEGKTVTRIRRE
jgi:hypothetical protein